MTTKIETKRNNTNAQTPVKHQAEEKNNQPVRKMRPTADIYESKEGATLYIDLPGVSRDHLNIDVEQNVLTIEGNVNLNTPDDLNPTYIDVHAGIFNRQFTLSADLDSSKIEAELKNGVLTLNIPRSEQHKPRKIEVATA